MTTCRDPGSTALGDRLRAILFDREMAGLDMRAEMLLFIASRAQLVDELIAPALSAGRVVVSDRFVLSNIVYQGDAGGLPVEEIAQVGRIATAGRLPDLTLVLDVPLDVARTRAGPSSDRIEDRPAAYHARVRAGFLKAAELASRDGPCPDYPAPIVVIDAANGPEQVFDCICHEVERALALGPRS